METFNRNVKFVVSLSNGQTFFEGKEPFQLYKNELSPWLRLQKYIAENRLHITSLGLYTDTGARFNLPSLGNNPRFAVFSQLEKPFDFTYFRRAGMDVMKVGSKYEKTGQTDSYVIVSAHYSAYDLQIWVNEFDTKLSYSLVIPKQI